MRVEVTVGVMLGGMGCRVGVLADVALGAIVQVGMGLRLGEIVGVGALVLIAVDVKTTAVQVGILEAPAEGVWVGAYVLVRVGVRLGFMVLVKMGVFVIVEVAQGKGVCVRDTLELAAARRVGVPVPSERAVSVKSAVAEAGWVSVGTKTGVWVVSIICGAVTVRVAVENSAATLAMF